MYKIFNGWIPDYAFKQSRKIESKKKKHGMQFAFYKYNILNEFSWNTKTDLILWRSDFCERQKIQGQKDGIHSELIGILIK